MHKVLRFALLFTLLAPSLAWADDGFFFDPLITKEYLESLEVNVSINDNATGACWTNLKEVREYAEEKLRTLGVKVSETNYMVAEVNIYWFIITIPMCKCVPINSCRLDSQDGSLQDHQKHRQVT